MNEDTDNQELQKELLAEESGDLSKLRLFERNLVRTMLISWALFQLALPKWLVLDSIIVRAIHLCFAITITLLAFPVLKRKTRFRILHATDYIPIFNYLLAFAAGLSSLYIVLDWEGISARSGLPLGRDLAIGIFLIVCLLEASRRVLGLALPLIAILFSIYAFAGPYMPEMFAFKGVGLGKYVTQLALTDSGIYGQPLDVSANTVFLYVLLGGMLAEVGAGRFFNDLAICLLGTLKGGPAKASVVSSGLTGLVSGSSIANVVTTGTFTIPLMKKVGYPPKLAAATEVAASTNGQLMPPIMGAAAFIIAEQLNMPYTEVVKAAFVPAFVSYIALFYIVHLEASKLGMKGLKRKELPKLFEVLKGGAHFLVPMVILIVELMWLRHSAKLAAFNAILTLVAVILVIEGSRAMRNREDVSKALLESCRKLGLGMSNGSWNMLSVALATATAGIVVGIVGMGIGSMVVQIVEQLAMGNIMLLLVITAIASLILGMGLPTTATYIVMASLTVPVIVTLSAKMGVTPIPAIAAHLFCFYFGILADDTPPVGLAAYSAAAIAKSDPIATGIQGFIYDLRTAIIPFMFVFNPELVLYGINDFWQGTLIFAMATLGAMAFTNAVQGWGITKNLWWEAPVFLVASLLFFWPGLPGRLFGITAVHRYVFYIVAAAVYAGAFLLQWLRLKRIGQSIPTTSQ